MAVHYVGGGGGLLPTIGRALSLGASFIPGMQAAAPFIGAAGALARGDVGGAIGGAAGGFVDNMLERARMARAGTASNRDSLFSALGDAFQNPNRDTVSEDPAWRGAYRAMPGVAPAWDSDPVTARRPDWRVPWGAR